QPDFYSNGCNFFATNGFPAAQRSLCNPNQIAVDKAGNLLVADASNNRVLEFSKPFLSGFTANQPATLVFGQHGDFASRSCNHGTESVPSADSLCAPLGVTIDKNGILYISESLSGNNRVLKFDPPFGTDPAAD